MTEQEIRAAALAAAARRAGSTWTAHDVLTLAEIFAAYIRTGEVPPKYER